MSTFALLVLFSPFIAAGCTIWLGVKLRKRHPQTRSGTSLVLLPFVAFFFFVLLFTGLSFSPAVRQVLTWHIYAIPFALFLATEAVALRVAILGPYRAHAICSFLLCGVAGYLIFGSVFL
ncbi:hypothetical protein R1T40_02790 [Tritonibacter scottomollicae]|uniref:DUF3147 family protein n=1 Tax=Tritonibacter scottomollicae TaxID=483013 RepID=A0ABZ0HHF9_TRISK|nr:hypothetical protein [Tritonibacter scottomollicae]WOI33696.1 hypothetical protein R1T40_02790 [Tritonibacter scottomollicae]